MKVNYVRKLPNYESRPLKEIQFGRHLTIKIGIPTNSFARVSMEQYRVNEGGVRVRRDYTADELEEIGKGFIAASLAQKKQQLQRDDA